MSICLNFPINSVSFGQTSIAILREAFRAKLDCCIFPIGPVDLSAQNPDPEFEQWLHATIKESPRKHKRSNRTLRLWHINGSLESYGEQQELLTFHEVDSCTSTEVNILNNQKIVWVTSNYTKQVMEDAGVKNVRYLDLGFDTHNFSKLNKKYYPEGTTVIGLGGKFEITRKKTPQILQALAKEFGNRRDVIIHAAVYNTFLSKEDNEKLINQTLGGQKYFNFNILPHMPKNAEYNDFLNSCDIFLGCSGGEGKDLPVYQAASLGKKIVALNAHAYKDYLSNDNAWLIEPNGKCLCYDNIFFHQGGDYNQGNFYTFNSDDMIAAIKLAISSPAKAKFEYKTYKDTYDQLMAANTHDFAPILV